jgi:hypothetical protein
LSKYLQSIFAEVSRQSAQYDTLRDDIMSGRCVVVSSYENQRFLLGQGWSADHLLPTDRSEWSDKTGKITLPRESHMLPSDDWVWDGPWQLDLTLRQSGEVDENGWQYALDFPWEFAGRRTWVTSVRRRRWIRVRKLADTVESGVDRPDQMHLLMPSVQKKVGGRSDVRSSQPLQNHESIFSFLFPECRI